MKAVEFAKILISLDKSLFSKRYQLGFKSGPTQGNLVLNKYLHIGQMLYLAEKNTKLFTDDIICFLNGGVVVDVYQDWNRLIEQANTFKPDQYGKEKRDFAEQLIKRLKKFNEFDLVEISHVDPSWQEAFPKIEERKLGNVMAEMEKHISVYKKISDALSLKRV